MSRSILIVVCDFLVLSLLSIANFDEKPSLQDSGVKDEVVVAKNFADSQMVDLLKMSLDSERERRETLKSDVHKLEQSAQSSKEQSDRKSQIIADNERKLEQLRRDFESSETQKRGAIEKNRQLEKLAADQKTENADLQRKISDANAKLEQSASERIALQKRLGDMRENDAAAKAKLESIQSELLENKELLEKLRQESAALKLEKENIEAQRRNLAEQLKVESAKTRIYEENLKVARAQVDLEKSEKSKILVHADKLATGVSELATSQKQMASSQREISKDVRNLRPQTPSEIFTKVGSSLVSLTMTHSRKGGLLASGETKTQMRIAPVKIDEGYWLVFAVKGTPLAPAQKYFPPEKLSIEVAGKSFKFAPTNVYAIDTDRHLLAVRVPAEFIEKEKIEPLTPSKNPFGFSDCIVINSREPYYGQAPFRADFEKPKYAKLDVGLFQSIFGTFAPETGDIVISRGGEFLGYMASSDLAAMPTEIKATATLPLGLNYNPAQASAFVKKLER